MPSASWLPIAGSVLALITAMTMYALQLGGRLGWETWWVPFVLALAAPLGILASYGFTGALPRGLVLSGAAWALLIGAGALGYYAGATTDRGGEVLALIMIIGAGATLLFAAWTGWDLLSRARA